MGAGVRGHTCKRIGCLVPQQPRPVPGNRLTDFHHLPVWQLSNSCLAAPGKVPGICRAAAETAAAPRQDSSRRGRGLKVDRRSKLQAPNPGAFHGYGRPAAAPAGFTQVNLASRHPLPPPGNESGTIEVIDE